MAPHMRHRAQNIHKGIQHIGAMLHCDVVNELRALFCHLGAHITLDFIYYPPVPYMCPVSIGPVSIGTGRQICTVKYVRSRI